ncbi:hypothetical protein [Roseimaritima sediminicola]|uniref:hypothetical protein n=1 Tax=Roseimaritima sediminicola TaxID=2662066 RepID=UPI0012983513|nr:hypothetical protein [Roseimaritima sediminicola]
MRPYLANRVDLVDSSKVDQEADYRRTKPTTDGTQKQHYQKEKSQTELFSPRRLFGIATSRINDPHVSCHVLHALFSETPHRPDAIHRDRVEISISLEASSELGQLIFAQQIDGQAKTGRKLPFPLRIDRLLDRPGLVTEVQATKMVVGGRLAKRHRTSPKAQSNSADSDQHEQRSKRKGSPPLP